MTWKMQHNGRLAWEEEAIIVIDKRPELCDKTAF